MSSCIFYGERAVHERHIIAVKEALCDVGGLVGFVGELGIGRAVDAVQCDLAAF
jgi:hypothetical protein